jgi:hypothetical protein
MVYSVSSAAHPFPSQDAAAQQAVARTSILTQLKSPAKSPANDSFDADDDVAIDAKNLARELKSKPSAGAFTSSVPVKAPATTKPVAAVEDEGEEVDSEEETESESEVEEEEAEGGGGGETEGEDDFGFETTGVPIRGALRSSECDILESVEVRAIPSY